MKLRNPLLPGMYPDPSVCRKGDDYYLITSSFEFFPGIPVFHSKDFVHWHQISHVLTRPEQLNLDGLKASKGIYASTIRYKEDEDLFYVVTTLVREPFYYGNLNFYVTAKTPEGPWSDPVEIKGAESIDPTLFYDNDKTYYVGNLRPYPEEPIREERWIWMQEMNLKNGELIGERKVLRERGASDGADAPEGPHLYHFGEYYYLMIAEGGTNLNHSETIFRSKNVWGPYEPNPRNPLITHRNLTRKHPINCTGHADIIQLHNGEWWAVLLASRLDGGPYRVLGRETFAVPVIWEEGWPVFSPETGHVEFEFDGPKLLERKWPERPELDNFDEKELSLEWNYLRTPRHKICSLDERKGYLRLYMHPSTVNEQANPSLICRRMQHISFSASTLMETKAKEGESQGMVLLFNDRFNYQLVVEESSVVLYKTENGIKSKIASECYSKEKIYLKVLTREKDVLFFYASEPDSWKQLGDDQDIRILSMEIAGGFTGTYIALYASSNGRNSSNYADFDWFEYKGL